MTYSEQIEKTSDGDHTDYPTFQEFLDWEKAIKGGDEESSDV